MSYHYVNSTEHVGLVHVQIRHHHHLIDFRIFSPCKNIAEQCSFCVKNSNHSRYFIQSAISPHKTATGYLAHLASNTVDASSLNNPIISELLHLVRNGSELKMEDIKDTNRSAL